MARQAAVRHLTATCVSSTTWRTRKLSIYDPVILVEVVRTLKFTCRPVRTRKSTCSPPSQLLEKPTEVLPKVSSRTEVLGHVIIALDATSHRPCPWDPVRFHHGSLTLDETASQAIVTTVATGHETTVVTTGADAATAVAVVIAVVDTVVMTGHTPLHLPLLILRGRMFCSSSD